MQLRLDTSLGRDFQSQPQRIRLITETWTTEQGYCPACGTGVRKFLNNRPVADFFCPTCQQQFEQKAHLGHFGARVIAGQYDSMIRRLNAADKPSFFFLQYLPTMSVSDFFVIPKSFITPSRVERRAPLGPHARRAGWTGSNLLLPTSGKVFYVKDGIVIDKARVLEEWHRRAFMDAVDNRSKGWLIDVMDCLAKISDPEFSISNVYEFEGSLQELHPDNRNVRAKIRQQLQVLRDGGFLEFVARGRYRKT